MARFQSVWLFFIFSVICAGSSTGNAKKANDEERKVYIVYMGGLPKIEGYSPSEHHVNILREAVDSNFLERSLVRSYTRSFNAFAANLTEQEQQTLADHDDVVSIFPSRTLQLLTTESWDFMGFPLNVNRSLEVESDIIIGVIDSGIWPESESFKDTGIGHVPKRWKGVCQGGRNFTCNNKIIGARHYDIDDSARDLMGHGSHTASTAAGINVANASYYGIAQGTARGGVPSARIAVYKVCSLLGCSDYDVLTAFDDAIADGVDIITISIGGGSPTSLKYDALSIGSLHAVRNGILTVNAAGNSGIQPGRTVSVAPWLISVAASTTKRRIISEVALGNGTKMYGKSVNSFNLNGTKFPLVYGKDAALLDCDDLNAKLCTDFCLNASRVEGKIVLCNSIRGIITANEAGAVGTIVQAGDMNDVSYVVPLAASVLTQEQFKLAESYYNSTKDPYVSIFPSQPTEDNVTPVVASFSSRGPNLILPDILKPDITAPGVDILAAFSPLASPSGFPSDKRSVKYGILTGTSMACPHVASVSAYVKSFHPDWSPSVIKSALMTTAWRMNSSNTEYKDGEFSYGAGHIDPLKALNPGLVYETLEVDYIKMLCSLKFDSSTLGRIFGDNTTCPKVASKPKDMNYPTMTAQVDEVERRFSIEFPRTVTNVGLANSTYKVTITKTADFNITVMPSILSFKALKEKKSFVVTVTGGRFKTMRSASIEWSDGIHTVRSPIVVYVQNSYAI